MLPRKLRVTRARKFTKSATESKSKISKLQGKGVYQPKPSANLSTLAGRAGKLLGRAGGYNIRKQAKEGDHSFEKAIKSPETIVFEGHRARQDGGKSMFASKNKKGKRTKRSTAFRSRQIKK
jgi:nucleolar protein 12